MIRFRPFRNDDTPALVEVWRNQPRYRGIAQPVSAAILERFVFSKLYFDRRGLIIAEDSGRVIGFVHCGFGPNDDRSWSGCESGVVSLLLVSTEFVERESIAAQLLVEGEKYLRESGARVVYGGGYDPNCPYYFGLYGSSHLPGILVSDQWHTRLFNQGGYQSLQKFSVMRCQLLDLRPVVNRQLMNVRRRTRLDWVTSARVENWWDANLAALHDFTTYRLMSLDGKAVWASADFWDMEPLAASWGVHAAGLTRCGCADACAEPGAEMFLLTESLKHLYASGVSLVETLVRADDAARLQMVSELGFLRVDEGVVFAKE